MTRAEELLDALRRAVSEYCAGSDVGVLFSGGLDSSVIAQLASEGCRPTLYTIGIEGSHDLAVSEVTAEQMGLDWVGIVLGPEEIIEALPRLAEIIGVDSPLTLSFELPLYFVARKAGQTMLLSGQGADELFGGYAKYLLLTPDELVIRMNEDLEGLMGVGLSMEQAIASKFGKEVRHPYLHHSVVLQARGLSAADCIRGQSRKVILREVASLLSLHEVSLREKKAAQYGSGVMRVMKSEARKKGLSTREFVARVLREGA